MRKTIRKANSLTWNFDKEEKWLNEMAEKGLCLVSVGFFKYEFEECEPGEYRICMQALEKREKDPESKKYIEFVENTGAEHIGTYSGRVYFRKKASEGTFELLSDNASRIKHLSRRIANVRIHVLLVFIQGVVEMGLFFVAQRKIYFWFALIFIALGVFFLIDLLRIIKIRKKLSQEGQLFE